MYIRPSGIRAEMNAHSNLTSKTFEIWRIIYISKYANIPLQRDDIPRVNRCAKLPITSVIPDFVVGRLCGSAERTLTTVFPRELSVRFDT